MKIVQGILIGALFSAILSAICSCYIALTSNTVSDFGLTAKDFWWLAIILGGIAGLILGGAIGGIVVGLHLNPILGGLMGLLMSGLPVVLLSQAAQGKFDENHIRFGTALIFIEALTGIVVSLAVRFLSK